MADITAKRFEEMDSMLDGVFVRARAELGVSSFGMQVINLPPGFTDYPEHAHIGMPFPEGNDGRKRSTCRFAEAPRSWPATSGSRSPPAWPAASAPRNRARS